MQVYIASTSEDLTTHRDAAREVTAELGFEVVSAVPERDAGRDTVAGCARRIAHADLVLAIVGWRRGEVPGPELGGDGQRSWTEWQVASAFRQAKPVVVLEADDSWSRELRENDSAARARVADFRGELGRLAVPFAAEPQPVPGFRRRLRQALERYRQGAWVGTAAPEGGDVLRLRQWPPQELPERPYPLLLPYTHPDLLGGRRRELEKLLELLAEPVPILGLYAPSGAGKSSLLGGGLVPWLRAAGRPAAFERHADEPGLTGRLLGDLLAPAEAIQIADDDHRAFVERLLQAARLAGRPPVLVLDQLEDLLRPGKERARAVAGTLLAASVQRQPGYHAPPCRWVLAYRQEFHGEVCGWLADVLGEVPGTDLDLADASGLPHDLSGPERFHAWTLPTLGMPSAGSENRAGEAAEAFRQAIETPLVLRHQDGEPRYRWRFAADGAARLARAFAATRLARPVAPLVPELQVVLAHLLAASGEPEGDEVVEIEVPAEPGELIDRALEEHLRRALDAAFPSAKKAAARIADAWTADVRTSRTRALLALRELADAHGRRREGRPIAELARAIGQGGRDVLEKLATPQTRLVLLQRHGDGQLYVLSHDRMAEVVVRLIAGQGTYAGLGVDAELLELRRFVALQRELFTAGEVEQATTVPKHYFQGIERHIDALLWDDEGHEGGNLWWEACRERRRRDQRRQRIRHGAAAAAVVLLTAVIWTWTQRHFERQALLETIVGGDPEASFAALADLTAETGPDVEELLAQVRQRETPFDVLERGLGGVDEDRRGEALLRVAGLLLPLQQAEAPEDPSWIASMVWALDFFARPDPALREQAVALREEVLGPLRRSRPPPPLPDPGTPAAGWPAPDDPEWANVPAGTFLMGSGPGEGRDEESMMDECPRHPVSLSAFRLMVHEVTNAEFARLFPEWAEREKELPAAWMNWYEAYTYAAWLGGRLPTEAEWEYAARGGCASAYCKRDGSEATLDDVAWWFGNSADPKTGEPSVRRVMQREPNPWGLYDVYGNVWEINANWNDLYPEGHESDPGGSTNNWDGYRTARGGDARSAAKWVVSAERTGFPPGGRSGVFGLRVTLPEDVRF